MTLVAIVAIVDIALIACAFAIALASEVGQRRKLRQLQAAAASPLARRRRARTTE